MKTSGNKNRGSMLLAVMLFTTILALAVGFLLEYVATSYRNSARQRKLLQVKSAAENEMEFMFYTWKQALFQNPLSTSSDVGMRTIPAAVQAMSFSHGGTNYSMANATPFLASSAGLGGPANYIVTRAIDFSPNQRTTGLTGSIPPKTGQLSYFVAKVHAQYTDPMLGLLYTNVGRRFIYSETSLFQYSVFYQGDMEFSSGTNMSIRGDLASNGSIFLGVAQAGSPTMTVYDNVRYAGQFNGADDAISGTLKTKYGNNAALADATFSTSRASQVARLTEPENFLGGIDVSAALATYPTAYPDQNSINRAVIAPPPVDGGGVLVPEDPTVQGRRMYNRAGLIIKVSTVGGVDTVSAFTSNNGTPVTDITSQLVSAGVIPSGQVRALQYDYREGVTANATGGIKVKMTTIDVAALKTAITSNTIPALTSAYNGFLYVYDTDPVYIDGGTPSNSYKAGVRLINGDDVPDIDRGGGDYTGFTVATNNGLYVQGNYNTVPKSLLPNPSPKSAALLGDAVTVLSSDWTNAYDDTTPLGNRIAGTTTARTDTFEQNGRTTIVAAIVSGNTASLDASHSSGGVQNLVRYLENWSGKSVQLYGSLGQLFESQYFNSTYKASGYAANVYGPPARDFLFDDNLAKNPKGGWPSTITFFRGDYFNW